jgi:hypothetical protein
VLKRAGLVAFKGANKGTVATLLDARIFRIEAETTGEQTGEQTGVPRGAVKGERTGEPGATKKKERQKKEDDIAALAIPEVLETDRFIAAWGRWKRHRSEINKPLKPASAETLLSKLAGWGEPRAVAAIEHSLSNGWQGIFEPASVDDSGQIQLSRVEGRGW